MSFPNILSRRPWRRGSEPPEAPRQLAFEVLMHAATLAGEDDSTVDPDGMSVASMLIATRDYLDMASHYVHDAERELAALRQVNIGLRQAEASQAESPGHVPSEPPVTARELIRLADRLVSQRGEQAPTWLEASVARLLQQSEIYRIEDGGEVDPARHEVISVRRTPDGGLVNHIAATVRVGYGWQGQILRPQEVVAYVAEEYT